jgi:hypothetical protein
LAAGGLCRTTDRRVRKGFNIAAHDLELALENLRQQHRELVRTPLISGGHQTPADDVAVPGKEQEDLPRAWEKHGYAATSVGAFPQLGELPFDSVLIVFSQNDRKFMVAHDRLLALQGKSSR